MENSKVIDLKTDHQIEKPYNRCLECPDLGTTCDGPNMLAMTLERWAEWCRARKEKLGWTNAYISEQSGVSIPTIDRIMTGHVNKDIRRSTMADISAVLVGTWGKSPCARPATVEVPVEVPVEVQVEVPVDNPRNLKRIEEQSEEIKRLHTVIETLTTQQNAAIARSEESGDKKVAYLKELVDKQEAHMVRLRGWLASSSVLAAIFALVIIAALAVDAMSPNIGFFWMG